jgi:hypothetical protein
LYKNRVNYISIKTPTLLKRDPILEHKLEVLKSMGSYQKIQRGNLKR